MSGWIKLHRQIINWEWYTDHNTFRVFLQLLLTANHKDKKFKGMELKAGTIVTSRDLLAIATGLSVRQVRTALNKLKTTNELTIKTSPQGTIIQIVNYIKYQVETNEMTNERPTSDQRATTNKNVKNIKNEKNIDYLALLGYINLSFGRRFELINDKTKRSYEARLKEGYTKERITDAITNAAASKYHKENNYQYCTPEFFSRAETIDKYSGLTIKTDSDSILAHLNK